MGTSRFIRLGGIAGLTFAGLWLVCALGLLMQTGIADSTRSIAESVELSQSPAYRYLLTIRFVAIFFAIPFALAAGEYLVGLAPGRARTGTAFLLLYATLWFVWHSAIMASSTAQTVDEPTLSVFLTLVGMLASSMVWATALFQGAWGAALVRRKGLEQVAGSAFLIGVVAAVVDSIMRTTGPNVPAAIMHQLTMVFMIVGVGSLGLAMFRGVPYPVKEGVTAAQQQVA